MLFRSEVTIRAVGYELPAALSVQVSGERAQTADLALQPVQDLSGQMTNAEWMASMPGSDREKRSLLTCVTCHTLERVVKSKYSSQEFLTVVLPRMQSYVNQSMPGAPQMRKGARLMEEQGEDRVNIYREMGDFLAQINLHNRSTWSYPLKTFPHPTGEATKDNLPSTQLNQVAPYNRHVDGKVWTQNSGFAGVHRFDLKTGQVETWAPFKNSKQQHNIYDVISDSCNNVFFTDFCQQEIGRIDAVTGKITFYSFPTKLASPRRGTMDDQDRLWVGQYRGHKIGMLDTKTGEMKEWLVPTSYSAPYDAIKDREEFVWTGSMTTDRIARLNLKNDPFTEYLLPHSTNVRRVFVQDNAPDPIFLGGQQPWCQHRQT